MRNVSRTSDKTAARYNGRSDGRGGSRRRALRPVDEDYAPLEDTRDDVRDDSMPAGAPMLTLPSHPALPRARGDDGPTPNGRPRGRMSRVSLRLPRRRSAPDPWDDYASWNERDWDEDGARGEGFMDSGPRPRAQSAARPLRRARPIVAAPSPYTSAPQRALTTASVPDLVAFRPSPRDLMRRAPVHTRAIIERAKRPWSVARMLIALLTVIFALGISRSAAGEPSQQPLTFQTAAGVGALRAVASSVTPITQLIRCDEYDSPAECQEYGNAACSAAALTEILTAWGEPNITIGRMIRELGPDISPNGGLLTHEGFQRAAAQHGYRADLSNSLTYNQMLYIANTLGIPLIVDVRVAYGYYHFLAGGHFLVLTGGDQSGVRIADSSEYYIHWLPRDVFYSMFTGGTALLVPQDFHYTLPSS